MTHSPNPFFRLLEQYRKYRGRVCLATAFSVLNKIFDLAPPLLIGAAVDVVVEREDSLIASWGISSIEGQLWVLAGVTLLIWALESLFEYAHSVCWRNLAQTLQHDIRIEAYDHVQRLDLAFFEDQSTGGLLAILNDDVNQLERFLDGGANEILQLSTAVLVIGVIFFGLQPTVAALAFLPVPFVLWGSLAFQRRIAPRYARVREQVGALSSLLSNNLGGIVTIKSFTAEDYEVNRVQAESERYRESNRAAIRLSSAFSPLIRMVIVCGFALTLVLGGQAAVTGGLAVGAYSVMVFLTQRLLWPLTRLGQTVDLYQRAMASTARVLDLLGTPIHVRSGSRSLPTKSVGGRIEFRDVSFSYSAGPAVVKGLSFTVPAGETCGIVGATGAGKTSVMKLLLRFYEPDSGVVALDGIDLKEIQLPDLRKAIGFVSQDIFLFHGTVRENIRYGARDASDEEIVAAARAAEAHDFIEQLPLGYDTIVGERGQKLSGGQRQRVSIARAVLKDPPILVLDEATSAVDNETEAAIQRSLARISVGRTTIVIAHRLSTIRHAHRIHVLQAGALVEAGTHDELIAEDGLYAGLWRVQTGEQVFGPSSSGSPA